MVRHEAAEALGAIASPEALALLAKYIEDENEIVKESCVVALDAADYWTALAEGAAPVDEGEGEEEETKAVEA